MVRRLIHQTERVANQLCIRLLTTIVFFVAISSQAMTAPLTLLFNSQVTEVYKSPNALFDLPFNINVGDTVSGAFTFEPLTPMGAQTAGLRFDLSGTSLQSPTYDIFAELNALPPLGFPDQSPTDTIDVVCSLLSTTSQCSPGTVPGSNIDWRAFLSVGGKSPILSDYKLPGDVATWNQFDSRSLELSFTPSSGTGLIQVRAALQSFVAVPEPAILQMVLIAVLFGTPFLICPRGRLHASN
jgi:hypothetical protein